MDISVYLLKNKGKKNRSIKLFSNNWELDDNMNYTISYMAYLIRKLSKFTRVFSTIKTIRANPRPFSFLVIQICIIKKQLKIYSNI